jgi:fucose 4-O-acetylase-like acetyltransferase
LAFSIRRLFPQFFAYTTRTLLVPYYMFCLYFLAKPLALLLVPGPARDFKTGYDYSMGRDFYDVLVSGSRLWFLWAYFVGELVTYGIVKLVRSRSYDAGGLACCSSSAIWR